MLDVNSMLFLTSTSPIDVKSIHTFTVLFDVFLTAILTSRWLIRWHCQIRCFCGCVNVDFWKMLLSRCETSFKMRGEHSFLATALCKCSVRSPTTPQSLTRKQPVHPFLGSPDTFPLWSAPFAVCFSICMCFFDFLHLNSLSHRTNLADWFQKKAVP